MNWVVDASVVVKWFVDDELSEAATALLDGSLYYAPELIISEITNALWKQVMRGHMAHAQAEAIAAAFPRAPIELIAGNALHRRALTIAIEIRHSAYDCFYLACAEQVAGGLITAEARLSAAVRDGPYAGLVHHLAEWPA